MITTNTRRERRIILRCLQKLKAGEGRSEYMGICGSVDDLLADQTGGRGVSYDESVGMTFLFKGWKDGRHDRKAYPISGEVRYQRAEHDVYLTNNNEGPWAGDYLTLRLDLIDHAIRKLRELGV